MKTGMAEMMEKVGSVGQPAKPSREQLEGNIRTLKFWTSAIEGGQYKGKDAIHITTLLNFLDHQFQMATKEFEENYSAAAAPEWHVKPAEEVVK